MNAQDFSKMTAGMPAHHVAALDRLNKAQQADIQIEPVSVGGSKTFKHYLVKRGERILGMLRKGRDTRADKFPWQSYQGVGMGQQYLGAHYGPHGRLEAIADVINAAIL